MTPEAAAQALFHTLNTHIRTNVNRTVAFVQTGELETRPHPFRPREKMALEVVDGAKHLHRRLKELGVNKDPELAQALRATIADHLNFVLGSLFSALDGEGAIYTKDGPGPSGTWRIR